MGDQIMAIRLTESEARDALHQEHSDTFKALHGFRPRQDISGWTTAELYAEVQSLHADVAAEFQAEVEAYPEAGDGWAYDGDAAALDAERMEVMHDECFFGMTYDEIPGPGEDY
jgi:hypothetical protein